MASCAEQFVSVFSTVKAVYILCTRNIIIFSVVSFLRNNLGCLFDINASGLRHGS